VRLENHSRHEFYGKVDDYWILSVQNKIRIYCRIEMRMVVVKSHSI
jgi:hypothetical protein